MIQPGYYRFKVEPDYWVETKYMENCMNLVKGFPARFEDMPGGLPNYHECVRLDIPSEFLLTEKPVFNRQYLEFVKPLGSNFPSTPEAYKQLFVKEK